MEGQPGRKRTRLEDEEDGPSASVSSVDRLSLLPPEVLEMILARCHPHDVSALACAGPVLRAKVLPMDKAWRRLCRDLEVPGGEEGKERRWRRVFLGHLEAWRSLTEKKEGIMVDRAFMDIVKRRGQSLLFPLSTNAGWDWAKVPSSAKEMYWKAKSLRKRKCLDLIQKTTMAFAYSEQYFASLHSVQDAERTKVTAWPIATRMAPGEGPREALTGVIDCELPFQHILLKQNLLLYIPLNKGWALLEACDLGNDCKTVARLFRSAEDEGREGGLFRQFPDVYKESGPQRIFSFRDKVLVVDCPDFSEDPEDKPRWKLFFVTIGRHSSQAVFLQLEKEFTVSSSGHQYLHLSMADQHEGSVALGFLSQDGSLWVAVCNMEAAGATQFLAPDASRRRVGALACSPFRFTDKENGGLFRKVLFFDGDNVYLSFSSRKTSTGKPYELRDCKASVSNFAVDHSAGVAVCFWFAKYCGDDTEVAGVCAGSLDLLWRTSLSSFLLSRHVCSCHCEDISVSSQHSPLLLAFSGLVLLGFPCGRVSVLRSRDGKKKGRLEMPRIRRVLPNLPLSRRSNHEVVGVYAQEECGVLWDLAVLPKAPKEEGEDGGWKLLVVYDLERYAPLVFDVVHL